MSTPKLAFSGMLNYINHALKLITDRKMYRLIQPSVRGGICHVLVPYASANNKLLGLLHDQTKPTSNILISSTSILTIFTAGPCRSGYLTGITSS